jgi:hypothetical protein
LGSNGTENRYKRGPAASVQKFTLRISFQPLLQ